MKKLIRPSCSVCKALAKAIDAYIAKVDKDLEDEMSDAGYVDAKNSIKATNDLEEEVNEILTEQTEELAEVVENAETIPKAKKKVREYFETDVTGTILSQTFADYFSETVLSLSNSYMKETEGDLVVSQLRARTSSWIEEWSGQLSDLMQLTSENQMGTLLQEALDNGEGCMTLAQRLINEGIRNEGYRARATAVTEMLRAHSVAQQESIMQSPATDRKKWVHSGSHKNKPRENHIAMNGQIVPKAEPFELTGRDGGTYHPMYPRDPILPAAESINCHCIHIPVSNDDILGLSYEERQQMQQDIIAADDAEWEKENSRKYGDTYSKETQVNWEKCSGTQFKKRIDTITESETESDAVFKSAKEILDHRNRTHYEDLSFIYPDGSYTTNDQYDFYDKEKHTSACKPSKKMLKELTQYGEHEVIGLHNHPESHVPSFDDIMRAQERKYKYGLAICHNGRIFKYKVSDDANLGAFSVNTHLDNLEEALYNEDESMKEEALRKLSNIGIEMEVLE